ncbi:MAG TPA: polysaccharide deacetylase family protein [Solirubrobacteraceae bacterium]|nr:polysaccharide deacetylase family protein [Solirubrobacteraceae bacterium]
MQERLTLGPAWVQAVKPALTRLRTAAWQARGGTARGGLRILFYHRVSDDRDLLAIAPRRFAEQMELLAAEGYRVVAVPEAARMLATGGPIERVVGLSFDDGYRDVVEHALPVLERHGFRATVFIATGVTDGIATFSWYERQPPLLDWTEIVALDGDSPLSFEAHTVTHPNLTALEHEAARREIVDSKLALEARLGREVDGFCYPAGLYGERERALVRDAGFRAATTCEPGANAPGGDALTLRRTAIDGADRLADFSAKLAGGHDRPSRLRAAYRAVRYRRSAAR